MSDGVGKVRKGKKTKGRSGRENNKKIEREGGRVRDGEQRPKEGNVGREGEKKKRWSREREGGRGSERL